MNWLDQLAAAVSARPETCAAIPPSSTDDAPPLESEPAPAAAARPSQAIVHQVTVTMAPSSADGPGEIAVGYYVERDGCVLITDDAGRGGGQPIPVPAGVSAHSVASVQIRQRAEGSGFNRRIVYPPLSGVV